MLPAWVIALTLAVVVLGLVLAWRRYAVSQVPVVPPLGTALTRAARVDLLPGLGQRRPARRARQHLTRSLVFADRAVVDSTVTGIRPRDGRPRRPRPPGPDRLRPLLRRDDRDPGLIVLVVAVLVTQRPRRAPTDVDLLPLADRAGRAARPRSGRPLGAAREDSAAGPARWRSGFAIAELVLAVGALLAFDTADAAVHQLTETYSWIPALGVSYAVGVDGVGLVLVLSVVLVPLVVLAAWREQGSLTAPTDRLRQYLALVLLLEAFIVLVFATHGMFLFYVVFEAMLIPVYFMIGMFPAGAAPIRRRGSCCTRSRAGSSCWSASSRCTSTGRAARTASSKPHRAVARPDAREVALPRLLPRVRDQGADVPGAHLAARRGTAGPRRDVDAARRRARQGRHVRDRTLCLPLFPDASRWAAPVVIVLAVVSILYGALLAIGRRTCRLVAYTSVSHFGFIVLGIFAFSSTSIAGSSFTMVNHGLSTGGLFLVVGFLAARRGSQQIADFGGLQRSSRCSRARFLVIGLSALSLPGLLDVHQRVPRPRGRSPRHPRRRSSPRSAWSSPRSTCCGRTSACSPAQCARRLAATPDLDGREQVGHRPAHRAHARLHGFMPGPALDLVHAPADVTLQQVGVEPRVATAPRKGPTSERISRPNPAGRC